MSQAVQEQKTVKIGDYTLTGKIGQGGVAVIYKAIQDSLNREVAIKILSKKMSADEEIVRRFERESVVVARLNHPNIVQVIDKGSAGGRYYFVMEYIDGTSLREVIDSKKIPLETKLEAFIQVCKALDYAHKNGIIHRDIKPTNILIDRQGNAKVADFGIAQIIGTPDGEMTSTDIIMGTLAYMSPEQKVSSTNVDHTTDIYAMGVMLYEMLTGKKPLGHFKVPSEINRKIDNRFDNIVLKCLAQEPKDRFKTAVELKDAILETTDEKRAANRSENDISGIGSDSFMGKCRYLDTIKETRFGSTVLVENRIDKSLYVIKKHDRGEYGKEEANILKSLKHNNIVRIFGSGGDKNTTVIISEYAPGGSLADRMVRIYDWEKAFALMVEVGKGLSFAHKNNIVHGNLRPSNILFDSNDIPKLSDFGLPIHYKETRRKNWYLAPERKSSKVADMYSFGVILFKLITGKNPEYDSQTNLMLGEIRRELPEDICAIFKKLLAIRVSHRFSSCDQFLMDYDDFQEDRKRAAASRSKKPVDVIPFKPKSNVWKYVVVGTVFMVVEVIVLYYFKIF